MTGQVLLPNGKLLSKSNAKVELERQSALHLLLLLSNSNAHLCKSAGALTNQPFSERRLTGVAQS